MARLPRDARLMYALMIYSWVTHCILISALFVGLYLGIRAIAPGRVGAWFCVVGCGLLLWEQLGTLLANVLVTYRVVNVIRMTQWTSFFISPLGLCALTLAAVWGAWSHERGARPSADEDPNAWSRGKKLLVVAMLTLIALPISAILVLAMVDATGTVVVPTTIVWLLTVPSIVTWILASRHLEALRIETPPSGQRPTTLWAYGVASVSSVGAIMCALFAFILLAIQEGWIEA